MFTSNPKGRLILGSTPKGQRGFFHRLWTEAGPEWLKIEKKASENPRLDPAILEEARRTLPEWEFLQEYECRFMQAQDQYFSNYTINKMFDSNVKPLWSESI